MDKREEMARAVRDALEKHVGPSASYADEYAITDAVLSVLREPDERMIAAGDACDEMRDEFTATPKHAASCEVHWQAMIDAIAASPDKSA